MKRNKNTYFALLATIAISTSLSACEREKDHLFTPPVGTIGTTYSGEVQSVHKGADTTIYTVALNNGTIQDVTVTGSSHMKDGDKVIVSKDSAGNVQLTKKAPCKAPKDVKRTQVTVKHKIKKS